MLFIPRCISILNSLEKVSLSLAFIAPIENYVALAFSNVAKLRSTFYSEFANLITLFGIEGATLATIRGFFGMT